MITRRLALVGVAALSIGYGCSPISVLNGLAPSGTYRRERALAYGAGARRSLDIYQPVNAAAPCPVVVFFYGGSWSSGRRDDYLFVGEALAARGIVTVIADYRLFPEVRYPDFLDDCAAALAWTLANVSRYGGDARRVVVAGHSAGAYNAAMLAFDSRWLAARGTSPDRLAGFAGLAGPYNFLPITGADIKQVFNDPDTPLDSQPVAHVHDGVPPTLLLAARNDNFVFPERNTEILAEKLRVVRADLVVRIYSGVSHTTLLGAFARPLRGLAPVLDDFSQFVLARAPVPATG